MDFLIRFAQVHETFRLPEIQSLAKVHNIDLEIVDYSLTSPFCRARLPSVSAARLLVSRSVLVQSIHELWGHGKTYDDLHTSVKASSAHHWPALKHATFRFTHESHQGSRSSAAQTPIFESFQYIPFHGEIRMKNPDITMTVFEAWRRNALPLQIPDPEYIYLGRFVANSAREDIKNYDLKKRGYISTTSFDAELSLVTANISLARPATLFYDPFAGTGSLPLACAHYGAVAWGSDIDGRSMRGAGGQKSVRGNFAQYGLLPGLGGMFTADLTNTPLARRRIWDGIVCDPPYGVREGLRVLGVKDPEQTPWIVPYGIENGNKRGYVPPKKPYSFLAMLDDILVFAATTLVDDGRISFWMPTANDEEQDIPPPQHPCLEVVSLCTQAFNKWSRRLITYRRIPDGHVPQKALDAYEARRKAMVTPSGKGVDELNPFRKSYFSGFRPGE